MKEIVIKGRDITTKKDFHSILKKELGFPEYYGNNLDALWDCLTGDISEEICIRWIEFERSLANIGPYAATAARVIEKAAYESDGKIIFVAE